MDEQTLVLGPPGTGKTTDLLNKMEQEMANGVAPNRIAFMSFTRKAADEARDRAMVKFNFKKGDLPHFGTIHSRAFAQQGLSRDDVMGFGHYKELVRIMSLNFNPGKSMEDGIPDERARGDRYVYLDSYARARCISPEDAWHQLTVDDDEFDWFEFRQFQKTLAIYKKDKGVVDFTDMLEHMAVACSDPGVDVTILDEAQDLSTLQWRAARGYLNYAKRTYIGGDDDQAIFTWSGADVNAFLSLPGRRQVLTQSHRLPISVHRLADTVAHQISRRFAKVWRPRPDQGDVQWHNGLESVDLSSGSWLLLARNTHLLAPLVALVREQGYAYTYRGQSVVKKAHLEAIQGWEAMRKGKAIPKKIAVTVSSFMPKCKVDPGKMGNREFTMADFQIERPRIWHETLTGITEGEREYYVALLRSGESISKEPRIHINNIHGVKGGEADNVLLVPDMAQKTFSGYQRDADDEHRVMYVGVTRCRQELHMLAPATSKFYSF